MMRTVSIDAHDGRGRHPPPAGLRPHATCGSSSPLPSPCTRCRVPPTYYPLVPRPSQVRNTTTGPVWDIYLSSRPACEHAHSDVHMYALSFTSGARSQCGRSDSNRHGALRGCTDLAPPEPKVRRVDHSTTPAIARSGGGRGATRTPTDSTGPRGRSSGRVSQSWRRHIVSFRVERGWGWGGPGRMLARHHAASGRRLVLRLARLSSRSGDPATTSADASASTFPPHRRTHSMADAPERGQEP